VFGEDRIWCLVGGLNQTSVLRLVLVVLKLRECASIINLSAPELFFFNFSTSSIQNVNNTGTKYVRFMKQIAF